MDIETKVDTEMAAGIIAAGVMIFQDNNSRIWWTRTETWDGMWQDIDAALQFHGSKLMRMRIGAAIIIFNKG
jgi:hypothetical protein